MLVCLCKAKTEFNRESCEAAISVTGTNHQEDWNALAWHYQSKLGKVKRFVLTLPRGWIILLNGFSEGKPFSAVLWGFYLMSQQERPVKGTRASPELLSPHYSAVSGSNTAIIVSSFHLIMSLVGFQIFSLNFLGLEFSQARRDPRCCCRPRNPWFKTDKRLLSQNIAQITAFSAGGEFSGNGMCGFPPSGCC